MKKIKVFSRLKAALVGTAVMATALVSPMAMPEQNASAASVDINYAKALQYSLYLYDANMCGSEVGEKSQLDWRDDCHTYDSKVSTPYGTMDLSGGFHDCGDHVKFNITGAYAATMLGWSYYEYKDAFTKTGQTAHLQTITDYFCDYFKRCTVMNGSSVQAYCYQVGDGNADHASWQPPEKDSMERPAYFATSSNPCTDVVAETAAALAMNYINFGNQEDLTYAKALYSFAKSNNKSNHSSAPFYNGTAYLDDLALAAIILNKATNDSSYATDCGKWIADSNWAYTTDYPLCWDSVWPAVNALYGKEWNRVAENIDKNKNDTNPEGYYCERDWGSARYNAALQLEGLIYDKYNNSSSYTSWAKGQMEYIFGANRNNQCYMVGYDSNSVKEPHHRAASGFTNFPSENRGKAFAHVLVGALVGGPDKSGNYYDEVDKYEYTEVGVDYNAAFVGALAGLYTKYGSGQSVASSVPGVSGSGPVVVTTAVTTVVTTTNTTASSATTDTDITTIATGEMTTEKITDVTTEKTTVKTTVGPQVPGTQVVDVNSQLDYSSNEKKDYNIELNKLVPSGAKAQKFIVDLSSNGGLENGISCGGGVSLTGGNWQQLQSGSQNISGSKATIEFDVSQYSDSLDYDNGVFQFSYWWGSQQTINIDSITCIYTGGSVDPGPGTTITTTISTIVSTTPVIFTPPTSITTVTNTTQPTQPIVGDEQLPDYNGDKTKLVYGDTNLDGWVTSADTIKLAKYFLSKELYSLGKGDAASEAKAKEQADVLKDGYLRTSDTMRLNEYNLKNIVKDALGRSY